MQAGWLSPTASLGGNMTKTVPDWPIRYFLIVATTTPEYFLGPHGRPLLNFGRSRGVYAPSVQSTTADDGSSPILADIPIRGPSFEEADRLVQTLAEGTHHANDPLPRVLQNSTAASLAASTPQELTLAEFSWLRDVERHTVPLDRAIRVERRYAVLSAAASYNRRSTRGKGIQLRNGEVALVTSLDEFCYVQAMEPGFQFTPANRLMLYRQAVSEARNRGYWVLTKSGIARFPPGGGSWYLADLARRAADGDLFRDQIEEMNRQQDLDNHFDDWRSYLREHRNVVDIGVFDRLGLRIRWKLHKAFGIALPRPPRQ